MRPLHATTKPDCIIKVPECAIPHKNNNKVSRILAEKESPTIYLFTILHVVYAARKYEMPPLVMDFLGLRRFAVAQRQSLY